MRRRDLLATLAVAATAPRALAAAPDRVYQIYMALWRGRTDVEDGFEAYLREHGLRAEFTWRDAVQDRARLGKFVDEIRAMRPDLVYTWGTSATLGVAGSQDAPLIADVPVLFVAVAQPVATGIVTRLSSQGRDVTGVNHVAPVAAQVEAMRAYRRFTKIGVLYNPAEPNSVAAVAELRAALGRKAQLIESTFAVDGAGRPVPDGVEHKIAEIRAAGAEWLYLGPDTFLFTSLTRVAAAAMAARFPTFASTESYLTSKAPVLAGLVSRYRAVGEFAGYKAEQILAGGKRARDVPVETLTRFSFVVRADVARTLDFLPPIGLLNYADLR